MHDDLLDALDELKSGIEARFGKEVPQEVGTAITPLSKLEERYHVFRQSLEEALALESQEG